MDGSKRRTLETMTQKLTLGSMIGCHQSWRISLLAAVVQVNSIFYNSITAYMRRRQAIIRTICDNSRVQRRFWVNPGRTSAWWDHFINEVRVYTSTRMPSVGEWSRDPRFQSF